jgi:hypothetical protein
MPAHPLRMNDTEILDRVRQSKPGLALADRGHVGFVVAAIEMNLSTADVVRFFDAYVNDLYKVFVQEKFREPRETAILTATKDIERSLSHPVVSNETRAKWFAAMAGVDESAFAKPLAEARRQE